MTEKKKDNDETAKKGKVEKVEKKKSDEISIEDLDAVTGGTGQGGVEHDVLYKGMRNY